MKTPSDRTVRDEWLACLTTDKEQAFRAAEARLEVSYLMLSVTLDEALGLRRQQELASARAGTRMCGALIEKLAARLLESSRALELHARHFGTHPVVAPLDPDTFRRLESKRAAAWNALLHGVLFAGRARWFHKLETVQGIVQDSCAEFCAAATELNAGTTVDPAGEWGALEAIHDDMNTCLREMVVMIRCFLRALPAEEVPTFRQRLEPVGDTESPARPVTLARATG